MSHPLFNQLQTSTLVGNPHAAFPTGVLGFPSSDSALGALVGGRFNQNAGNVRLNHPGGGVPVGCQDAEYAKKSGPSYPCDTDRRLQFNVAAGSAPAAASATVGDEQYKGVNPPTKNSVGFQIDYYGQDMQGQQLGFSANKQNVNSYNTTGHRDQWKGPVHLAHTGQADGVPSAAPVWTGPGQPMRPRMELYNPEEPTPEPKFPPGGGVSSGCPPPHGREEAVASGTRILQPYQVNDYHAVTPTQLPHQCSICDKKVYNLKDWDQHVKGKLHLQNRTLFANESDLNVVASAAAVHYAAGRPPDGSQSGGGMNAMVYAAAGQDVSNSSYMPAAAMTTYSTSDTGLASQQPESKAFLARKATAGRVVHICNLPEGSCTENDVINLGLPFGKVTNYILMRSTHQAFLEMAYVEAAQAMVQYYQLTPAMINNQKLLIRMSKRYKELQLKKPGKDVQLIIEDITSQRERDEMQELERCSYIPERARSRSPLSRSLSPHSHSPSFTSCSSAHSPQGAPCRTQERATNGLAPSRGSWDWPRRTEDEREREDPWRNGGGGDDERPNGRAPDRRKPYQKHADHGSSRSADERGGEGMRGSRDWHVRSSPQGASFSSYRSKDEDFYMKEPMYRSEKLARAPYQRHDAKPKRREGDYHSRPRHYEYEATEEPAWRTPEERRQTPPGRGRSEKTSKRPTSTEKSQKDKAAENKDHHLKDKDGSPQRSNKTQEAPECGEDKDAEKVVQSEDDTDEECWYPKNMEELVTVDEVGGEDDAIVEPDLPELEELTSCPKEPAAEAVEPTAPATASEGQETADEAPDQEQPVDVGDKAEAAPAAEKAATATGDQDPNPAVPELEITSLHTVACEESKASEEETCSEDKEASSGMTEEPMENHMSVLEDSQTQEAEHMIETISNGTQQTEIEAPSPSHNQDKAISEHSIPLGVEFIVPSTGFYCKLCGLFYTSEATAKTAHCRSTVHYRNLQKYLSQLAEGSLLGAFGEASDSQ
ncbi:RNA-binding protein 20 isoform X2 [Betta splendens]|nr:RNA-binding protein 20 isoform X2 [Betta splendens]